MSGAADNANLPWYRHFWVWLVMIPPASAVVAGFATAWLAGAPPALVVDDYSEIAMATQVRQTRDRRATELGLRAKLEMVPDSSPAEIRISLTSTQAEFREPGSLQLQLIHPTRQERDQVIDLQRSAEGYSGVVVRPDSRVYIHLGDLAGDWRLVGELPADAGNLALQAR